MRVYLSSTLKDLAPERQAVREVLSGLGKYAPMESYDADESSLRKSCLADVAACDLYVGIIGGRYGFIPPGETKSITELEFDAASKIRRLVFLKEPGAIPMTMCDAGAKESDPARIEAFRNRLSSGGPDVPRPTLFSSCDGLKVLLLRALLRDTSRNDGDDAQSPLDPASPGVTELERMLSEHLNCHWNALRGRPAFADAAVLAKQPRPLTPKTVFEACVGTDPVKFLISSRGYVGKRDDGCSSVAELAADRVLCDAVLLMTLVAAERYVKSKAAQLAMQQAEPISGADSRVAAVLAAAAYGFGVRFRPSHPDPENFVRLPAEELGHDQGQTLVRRELMAAAHRLTLEDPPSLSDSDLHDEDILCAILNGARDVLGCRLVLVTHEHSRLKEQSIRASVLGALDVPIVFEGVPREAVQTILSSLRTLIIPMIDGTLGPKQDEPPAQPTNAATEIKPRTEP